MEGRAGSRNGFIAIGRGFVIPSEEAVNRAAAVVSIGIIGMFCNLALTI